ncbi:MAG: tetratricopeptide repeat protein [Myxococcota bacterium]
MILLLYAWAGFKLWMLVDAIQRGVGCIWYSLIFFVPGGAIAYFVTEKAPNLGWGSAASWFQRPVPTAALEHAYRENPCVANEGHLAARLHDEGEFDRARELYERLLRRDPDSLRGHYGLGLCRRGLGRDAEAVDAFREVLARDRAYAQYAVWLDLADALGVLERTEERIEALRELVRANPRLDHTVALSTALIDAGRESEARAELSRGLDDFNHAPRHVRRLARPAAKQASKLLGALA